MIDGFTIGGYRSFGDPVTIGPLSKLNVIIGRNNSGKSNVLRAAQLFLPALSKGSRGVSVDIDPRVDIFQGSGNPRTRFGFCIRRDSEAFDEFSKKYNVREGHWRAVLEKVLDGVTDSNAKLAIFQFVYEDGAVRPINIGMDKKNFEHIDQRDLQGLFQRLTRASGGQREQWLQGVFEKLYEYFTPSVKVAFVPEHRRVSSGDTEYSFDGTGLISRLAEMQSPTLGEGEKRGSFDRLNEFVRHVLETDTVTLEVPHDRSALIINDGIKRLPLESVGTGVHQVIILAAMATTVDKQFVCIEEPEVHLNPRLQKQLLLYLKEKTDNQYLISTHSAHFLDEEDISIFHIRQEDGASYATQAVSSIDKSSVCKDLGYRPSDLLQTNCVIWVEGPSDRIYINWWIRHASTGLIEGIHYSFVFYGGRVLSHFSALDRISDPDFVEVLRISRSPVFVMDSDRSVKGERIGKAKVRIKQEVEDAGGICWVTQGREIENYLSYTNLACVIKSTHSNAIPLVKPDRFSDVMAFRRSLGGSGTSTKWYQANKIKIARGMVESYTPDFGVLDLRPRIRELIAFIEKVND